MDRRTFLSGMLGFAGAAAAIGVTGPQEAFAGVPGGRGILDELDTPIEDLVDDGSEATVQPVWHRQWHGPRRRRRRWVTRRVCRRVWRNGRRRVRCWRERFPVWVW
jgi:hypothetical protein